ncbi:hypothetical protein, conserved [Eimeria tenella]|uniref:Uncharacterized protein n=1 Tax=Eimeria tenella TaxID=5802 RepID=U6KWR0_EIMTE|nr:hypothetical protein, conserved [Eimeria tenella]CDJ39915.1 hypothetical protein, conserved [Eimeria tenella]|eukprot:XP_013230668.1 hypothetical protein, conserved [Eimeria tenella]
MASLCRIWSWFFDVSNPNDPKLRRWLHPTCALAFNAGLALLVAVAAFLAAPSEFHELWLQRQTPAVAHFAQHLTDLATSVGLVSLPAFQWLRRTAAALLLPQELMFDRKQAFALYSWDKGSIDPKSLGIFLAVYVALMLASRLYEKGAMMLYDAAWACNLSLALTALALWLNIPLLVSACSCWVAVDQLLWYVDSLSFVVRGRFLVGVAKYLANKDTPWTKKLFSTHHLWFIPFTTFVNLKYADGHSPCCLSVSMFLSLMCVLGSRCCTPYAVCHPEPSTRSKAEDSRRDGKPEKSSTDVLNVNVSWRCWADVTHHLPFLGMFDDKPWYMFVVWNQLIWGLGNCFLFGLFLTASNLLRH